MKSMLLLSFAAVASVSLAGPASYDWQKPHAKVLPNGELQYAPEPWSAPKYANARYIDFEGGDDAKDGKTAATAWKHHPNDPNAAGQAKENAGRPDAYLFKGGIAYRGTLMGKLANAVLTSVPTYGKGRAVITGAERVDPSSWTKAAHPRMPQGERVWSAKVDHNVRAVWCRAKGGAWERLKLARTPNWTFEDDPDDFMASWWTWEQPEWWTDKNKTVVNGKKMHLGVDARHLKGMAAEDLVGGFVWSEWGIVMGAPYASRIEQYDAAKAGVAFQGFWYGDSEKIITKNRYYLEDRPAFLDEAGEFWFDVGSKTLYARFPKDADPKTLEVETSLRCKGIDLKGAENVRITALDFERIGPHWRIEAAPFEDDDIPGAGVRVYGASKNLTIDHCNFTFVNTGVRVKSLKADQKLIDVTIADNRIVDADQDSIQVHGSPSGDNVDILRNWIERTGFRHARFEHGHCLAVYFVERLHLAGNFLTRTSGAGLFIFVGKGDGDGRDCPYARCMIHHNRVDSPLMGANDWGGIETWQGGPTYVWGNVSKNPGGYWNWAAKQDGNQRLGFAYYLDGGFKNYHFDNLAIGNSSDITSKLCNGSALYQATPTILNGFYNGLYRTFARGSGWNPQGGRHVFAGNRFEDISVEVFNHKAQKEDAGHDYGGEVLKESIYMVDNGLPDNPKGYRRVKPFIPWSLSRTVGEWNFRKGTPGLDEHWYMSPLMKGRFDYWKHPRNDLEMPAGVKIVKGQTEDWVESVARFSGGPGAVLKGKPVIPAPKREAAGAPAESPFRTLKPAPWVDVTLPTKPKWGENLDVTLKFHNLPAELKGQKLQFHCHWMKDNGWGGYLSHLYIPPTVGGDGEMKVKFINMPKGDYPVNFRAFSFLLGLGNDLENSKRADFQYDPESATAAASAGGANTSPLAEFPMAVGLNDFSLETIVATKGSGMIADARNNGVGFAVAVSKKGQVGFRFSAKGAIVSVVGTTPINDGKFHHVFCEIDRGAGKANVYVDGRLSGTKPFNGSDADASTDADLVVGRDFTGDIDFLRIAHSSLAESHTDIRELYTWEFAGPFLKAAK